MSNSENECREEESLLENDVDRDDPQLSDVGGEDLLGDDVDRDYHAQRELDVLSGSGLNDATDLPEVSAVARRAAERNNLALNEGQLPHESGDDESDDLARRRQIDEEVGKDIEQRFKRFLRSFKDETGQKKYFNAIKEMASRNKKSIEVDFKDLADDAGEPKICYFLSKAPVQILKCLDDATTTMVMRMFPWYTKITQLVSVRIRNLPMEEEIRALHQNHLNTLIKTTGVVTVTTGIQPQLAMAKYNCEACAYVIGPFVQRQDEESKPTTCPSCQSRGPFKLNVKETVYHNYQRITIQESPNLVGAGDFPRSKDAILTGDLCDSCKPGDMIELTGVYTSNYDGPMTNKQGSPGSNTMIIANHIARTDQIESDELTDEDINAIRELSKDPQKLVDEFKRLKQQILEKDQRIEEKDQRIEEKDRQILEKDHRIDMFEQEHPTVRQNTRKVINMFGIFIGMYAVVTIIVGRFLTVDIFESQKLNKLALTVSEITASIFFSILYAFLKKNGCIPDCL